MSLRANVIVKELKVPEFAVINQIILSMGEAQ
jgi:hypothetical protein